MDKRSWPWRRKTSEKVSSAANSAVASSNTGGNQGDQGNAKTIGHVQISQESYEHLTKLEDQVKVLNEKLSSAQSEMINKDNLVKQHAKVAEEAVAGWEKAEAETLALKHQLESVTVLKFTAEDRASHLDGALKECMKQIRNVKEESEKKLHETIFTKTKQWETIKFELETKIVDFEQELLRSSAENAALSRSLQERSTALMKMSEEKSQVEAEIEVLKSDIQSCERDINSLKYELTIVSKELEIRNEEKNMSVRSADAANKQHIEDVKKITKLEADCQRLRGLVRKKLPGPAALAQMKLEVENLGRDYGEPRVRRSPAKSFSPYIGSIDFALENAQQCHKENEFLTARLLATEEETKMLKEALFRRNSELQDSRNMCAKTVNKLRSIEHIQVVNQHKGPLKSNIDCSFERSLSQNESNASLTSMSEDGIDEEGSCSESGATASISERSQYRKGKNAEKSNKANNSKHLELMDDFLEMERLACLSTETNGNSTVSDGVVDKMKIEISDDTSSVDVHMVGVKEQPPGLELATNLVSCGEEQHDGNSTVSRNIVLLSKLQAKITCLFESQVLETDMGQLMQDIRQIMQDIREGLPQNPAVLNEETHSTVTLSEQENSSNDKVVASESGSSLKQGANSLSRGKHAIDEKLRNAISQVHDFVVLLCKEIQDSQGRPDDDHVLRERVEMFSASTSKVLCDEINIDEFVINLSHMLPKSKDLRFNMLSDKNNEENHHMDCIDKVTLLENSVVQHEPTKVKLLAGCLLPSLSASDPENLQGPTSPGFELTSILQKCSVEEFEQLKQEKNYLEVDLAKCTETLEQTKLQLLETEQHLAELKSQLAASQKSKGLADTQLKCIAESYNSMESRAQELQSELNLLRSKAEVLENELQEERQINQVYLAKFRDLQEQMKREERCSICSLHSDADVDIKTKQEREIAQAAEKLAECQETIILLGRQLKALHSPVKLTDSSQNDRHRIDDNCFEDEPSSSGYNNPRSILNTQHMNQVYIENDAASLKQLLGGGECPLEGYSSHFCPSDMESSSPPPTSTSSSKRQKHRYRSASSSSLSSMLNDKQGRGFSRFFSKGKRDY